MLFRSAVMTEANATGSAGTTAFLHELAENHHVATTFNGWDGTRREVSDATLARILGALGAAAATDEEIERSLAETRMAPWRRILPGAVVLREQQSRTVTVHLPVGEQADVRVVLEDGSHRVLEWPAVPGQEMEVDGVQTGATLVALPEDLPLGWHRLEVSAGHRQAASVLVVTPERLTITPALKRRRAWGLMAQLYSVRSSRSWGIGDLADLADLAALSGAEHGADRKSVV